MIPARECASAGKASLTRCIVLAAANLQHFKHKIPRYSWERPEAEIRTPDPQLRGRLQNRGQIHPHFFHPAARHQGEPLFRGVELVQRSVGGAINCGRRKIGKRMPDESRIHPSIAVKLLFEGKNHQRLVDVLAQQPHPPLPPAQNCGQT